MKKDITVDDLKFMYVYQKSLRNHLMDGGQKYITTALSTSSHQRFWLFLWNSEADELMHEYKLADSINEVKRAS